MQGDLLEDQQKGASSLTTELQKVREELLHTQTAKKTKLELDFNNEKTSIPSYSRKSYST